MQNENYTYNERSWLRTSTTNSTLFNLDLRYNTADAGTQQFNGNIAEMHYTGINSGAKVFDYTYDPVNRLIIAASTGGTLNEGMSYDDLGNITALTRGGQSYSALSYAYSGSHLTGVTGTAFTTRSYTYDGNGNANSDGVNKFIAYNILNLPQTLTQSSSTIATYYYDAAGQKLRTTSTADGNWDYINGIVYHSGSLSFINTTEGRITYDGTNYKYQYNLKDQLGNVRLSFGKGTGGTADLLQEDEYYAFGLRKNIYDNTNGNRYLYNSKERQADLTDQYDYGARFYDPVIGRWTTVDHMAEMGRRETPYGYAFDDPMRFTDPDGMWPDDGGCCDVVKPFFDATQLVTKQLVKGAIGVAVVASKLIDGENSHRAFSKDPAVRAEANKELKSDVAELAITAITAEVGGRLLGVASEGFNGTGPTVEMANSSKMLDIPGGPKSGSAGGPGAGMRFSNKTKIEASAEANGNCVLCGEKTDTGAPGKKGNTDHAIPKSRGGNNTLKNAQHTCANCNQILKKAKTTEEYLNQRSN